jgi:hypothetical protein
MINKFSDQWQSLCCLFQTARGLEFLAFDTINLAKSRGFGESESDILAWQTARGNTRAIQARMDVCLVSGELPDLSQTMKARRSDGYQGALLPL